MQPGGGGAAPTRVRKKKREYVTCREYYAHRLQVSCYLSVRPQLYNNNLSRCQNLPILLI